MKNTIKKIALTLSGLGCMALYGQAQPHRSLGSFTGIEKEPGGYVLNTNSGQLRLQAYSPTVIRVRASQTGAWDEFSYAVITSPDEKTNFNYTENAQALTFTTDSLTLIVGKSPVRLRFYDKKGRLLNEDEPAFGMGWLGEEATTYKKLQADEKFIGLGEKTGNLNRRGEGYTNWNTDNFGYGTNADPIYQSIPFYIGVHNGLQYGIFMDNSHKSHFNFGASTDRFSSFTAESGEMNYYFIGHSSVSKIIESYTQLTGRMEMPPLWSLGFQQCKYSYYPDKELLNVAQTFREKSIPADVLYLDIHYMEAYKVFTWHKERFPAPKTTIDQLKKLGFHLAVIIDPGIKVEKNYKAYEEGVKDSLFLTYPDKTNYTGMVWPGWCHFPDFTNPKTRAWWGQSFKSAYVDNGVEGFWNDMNEPATWGQRFPNLVEFNFEGKKGTHRRGHNLYGLQMSKATFEGTRALMNGKRPFILTRAGYAGIQRYSAVWTGDNVSTDDHMLAGIRLLNSMGLSGIAFTGMDVGGFTGNPSQNLFARWMSISAFTPFYRAHVAIDQKDQEPWAFGKKTEEISRNYVSLRYKLIPYLYSAFYEAASTGMPIQRSLALQHTHDGLVYDGKYQNQFYCGPAIMVAPVESHKDLVRAYLPGNDWYDLYNDKYYKGNEEIITACPIERLPVFVKGGSIVPMQSLVQNLSEQPSDTLNLHVYYGGTGSTYTYYEDDGESYRHKDGQYYKRVIGLDMKGRKLTLKKAEGQLVSKFKTLKVVFHGFPSLAGLKASATALKTATEYVNFIKPLPHFDPVGTGAQPETAKVQTTIVTNSNDIISLVW